jgi:hypothetical protein
MRFSSHIVSLFFGLAVGVMPVHAQYSVNMPHQKVTVENVKGTAIFNGAFCGGAPGQPALPIYKVSFLLPSDVDFNEVNITLDNMSEEILPNQYEVVPNNASDTGMIKRMKLNIVNGKDMGVYGKNAFSPADYRGNVSFGNKGQYKIVSVMINPYLYNPATKNLGQSPVEHCH